MRQKYKHIRFQSASLRQIALMNEIIAEYLELGFRLTIRQLYYQLVAKGAIENSELSYKRMGDMCNSARLGGLMDWDVIEDRTRAFLSVRHQIDASGAVRSLAREFAIDMWDDQDLRCFVIVEKEALVGVMERICCRLDVPLLAARGYPSVTVLHEFVQNVALPTIQDGQEILILHLGDHDPSGIDMTRDLEDRISMFTEGHAINLRRIALNMEQIHEQKPPPNPAKTTDSRFKSYREAYGNDSWELDALKPTYIESLIRQHIDREIDQEKWEKKKSFVESTRERLLITSMDFEDKGRF